MGESWDPVWTEPSTQGDTEWQPPNTTHSACSEVPSRPQPPGTHLQSLLPVPSARASTVEGAGSWPRGTTSGSWACAMPVQCSPGTAGPRLLPSVGSRRASSFTRLPPCRSLQAGSVNGALMGLGSWAAPKLSWRNSGCFSPSSSPIRTIPQCSPSSQGPGWPEVLSQRPLRAQGNHRPSVGAGRVQKAEVPVLLACAGPDPSGRLTSRTPFPAAIVSPSRLPVPYFSLLERLLVPWGLLPSFITSLPGGGGQGERQVPNPGASHKRSGS